MRRATVAAAAVSRQRPPPTCCTLTDSFFKISFTTVPVFFFYNESETVTRTAASGGCHTYFTIIVYRGSLQSTKSVGQIADLSDTWTVHASMDPFHPVGQRSISILYHSNSYSPLLSCMYSIRVNDAWLCFWRENQKKKNCMSSSTENLSESIIFSYPKISLSAVFMWLVPTFVRVATAWLLCLLPLSSCHQLASAKKVPVR